MPNGVLVIDKPIGPTSFDVVQKVRRALQEKKAGHTGTLDPMATGVLTVCLGEATKIVQFLTADEKTYDARIQLGSQTDTDDAEGQVIRTGIVPAITRESIELLLQKFSGTFLQLPPNYSAVRVAGKRLYELARAGQEVDRTPREVTVHELKLLDLSYDVLLLRVHCAKGFFVRGLARDIGDTLGCGAHLTALRRTSSGALTLAQAVPLQELVEHPDEYKNRLIPMDAALVHIPAVVVTEADAQRVIHGVSIEIPTRTGIFRILGPGEKLLAMAEFEKGRLRYRRVMVQSL